eukprot:TRINITY_DN161_c0_g1_i2.p2 TRINITY_DN161_c0_g1~~TRINITY_DN161_c0_g1_i2.p2  ORF type:complete len:146 (-),score=39.06 TRINITY_DN161_c0_g1_i2:33-470(-)
MIVFVHGVQVPSVWLRISGSFPSFFHVSNFVEGCEQNLSLNIMGTARQLEVGMVFVVLSGMALATLLDMASAILDMGVVPPKGMVLVILSDMVKELPLDMVWVEVVVAGLGVVSAALLEAAAEAALAALLAVLLGVALEVALEAA